MRRERLVPSRAGRLLRPEHVWSHGVRGQLHGRFRLPLRELLRRGCLHAAKRTGHRLRRGKPMRERSVRRWRVLRDRLHWAVPGSAGTCTNVIGAPHGARQACASDGSACGGVCDGSSATACAYPAAETSCRGASCAAGVATLQDACDGAGRCPPRQTQGCSPYLCGPQACLGNCTSDADCVSGNFCAAGICTPLLANGNQCAGASQCASGQCVDGVCCNAACGGQCQACDVPGQVGTCANAVGAPHGSRQACASDGTACGGACDGSDATQCAYPGATVECRAGSCSAGVMTEPAMCNGSGNCPAKVQDACGAGGC